MLSIAYVCANYDACHYVECRSAERLYSKCRNKECHYTECRGALVRPNSLIKSFKNAKFC